MAVVDLAPSACPLGLRYLAYPRLRDGYPLPSGWRPAMAGEPLDVVILTRAVPEHALDLVLNNVLDALIPVISLVSDNRRCIDWADTEYSALERANDIHARLRQLPERVRRSSQPEDLLLARLYSRDMPLEAVHDSSERDFVRYPVAGRMQGVGAVATRLFSRGLLTREFFDRIHICPDCRSARISVREECHTCRSAHLVEETVVHHFRCGHEAPESHFRSGRKFECPKCGLALRHIGLDYDKPGSVVHCADCDKANDQPGVGFRCMDCGAHCQSDQVPFTDWYSFRLTPLAIQCLLQGLLPREFSRHAGPDAFQLILEHAIREHREFNTPYRVVRLSFPDAQAIKAKDVRLWHLTLNLLHDVLHSALREVDVVRQETDEEFLVLLPRADDNSAAKAIDDVRSRAKAVVKVDLTLHHSFIDPVSLRTLRSGSV